MFIVDIRRVSERDGCSADLQRSDNIARTNWTRQHNKTGKFELL
jgi:hypothetical protein